MKRRPRLVSGSLLFLALALPLPLPAADPAVEAGERSVLLRERSHRRHRMPIRAGSLRLTQAIRSRFQAATHGYVRFLEIPDDVRYRELRRAGILLLEDAGERGYVAALTDEAMASIDARSGIDWMGEIPPSDKLAPIAESLVSSTRDDRGRISLRVRFHETATAEMARSIVGRHRGVIEESAAFEGGSQIRIAIDPVGVDALAAESLVRELAPLSAHYIPSNAEAGALSRTDELWEAPFELAGAGFTVGLWDVGNVFPHPEFAGRVSNVNGNTGDAHTTHVAGTIAASGNLGFVDSARSRGMANEINIDSYTAASYFSEFFNVLLAGDLIASSNGWEGQIGWFYSPGCTSQNGCSPPNPPVPPAWILNPNQSLFGQYTIDSRQVDQVAEFAENSGQLFFIVFASGNDRSDGPEGAFDGTFFPTPGLVNPYYDTIGPFGTAKNAITVGAVGPDKVITEFAGIGPTDDGRIKPDLVARGLGLTSPIGTGLADYEVRSGTSMATGVVTGSAVLVAEHFEDVFGVLPTNAELKALLLHSAEDLGNPGPDYLYGHGLLDARAAVDLIDTAGVTSSIESGQLTQGQSDSFELEVTTGVPRIACTLVWMDRPGNSTQPIDALVNDLNLTLTSPSNEVFFPFSLDPALPTAPATAEAPNTVDNVESLRVEAPETGSWTVEVEALEVPFTRQRYSVVCDSALAAPAVYDFVPPDGPFAFATPYRRPILSAKYVDSGGGGIDADSVEVRLNSFDVTTLSVVSESGVYFAPAFDFWLDQLAFKVKVANLAGVETNASMIFEVVEAAQVPQLRVAPDGSGGNVLNWGQPSYSNSLFFRGYRIYRSTDLQSELELIGQTSGSTLFTDPSPPPGLVFYEVHLELEGSSGHRILTVRDTPYRTEQAFAVYPRQGATTAAGSTEVRIVAMGEPGSLVTFFADGTEVGNGVVAADGSVSLTHDFLVSGSHTVQVQAKQAGEGLSVPSPPVGFEIP